MHPSWEFNPPNANDFQEKNTFEKKRGDDLTHHPLKFFGNRGRGQSAGASE